MLQKKMCLYFK